MSIFERKVKTGEKLCRLSRLEFFGRNSSSRIIKSDILVNRFCQIDNPIAVAGPSDRQVFIRSLPQDNYFGQNRDAAFVPRGRVILSWPHVHSGFSQTSVESLAIVVFPTFDDRGVGLRTTFPSSLSSRANIPGFSVYSFTLTTGKGCVVQKSPCVSHIGLEASAWSVCNFSPFSTSMVQYTIRFGARDFKPFTSITTT
jgi:hypothetical protein